MSFKHKLFNRKPNPKPTWETLPPENRPGGVKAFFNGKFFNGKSKGQSFIELSLILAVLLTLTAGVVEFGYMLNLYITIVDAAREGARFASNDNPFDVSNGESNYEPFFAKIYTVVQGHFDENGVQLDQGALRPISLSADNGDDIVVTFFSVTSSTKHIDRFESNAGSRYNTHDSIFSDGQIQAMIDPTAPNTGFVLVEIFYNYHQVLGMFEYTGVPDPILLHAYAIMPLSSAEPTPTPPGP